LHEGDGIEHNYLRAKLVDSFEEVVISLDIFGGIREEEGALSMFLGAWQCTIHQIDTQN